MITNRIISYHPGPGVTSGRRPEYLGDHVGEMIRLLGEESKTLVYGELLFDRYKELLAEKGVRIKYDYKNILCTAIVFHDIGKALYQERVINALRHSKYVSFAGHEVFSALLLDRLAKKLSREKPEQHSAEALIPAVFAVLYHHHSLILDRRIDRLQYVIKTMDADKIDSIARMIYGELSGFKVTGVLVNELLNLVGEEIRSSADAMRASSLRHLVNMLDENLKRIIASGKKKYVILKKIMYLTLSALIALDYEAARRRRGGTPTLFGRICGEWLLYYVSSSNQ